MNAPGHDQATGTADSVSRSRQQDDPTARAAARIRNRPAAGSPHLIPALVAKMSGHRARGRRTSGGRRCWGLAEDSELDVVVVVVEGIELAVRARAFVLAPLVVVAGDLREAASIEGEGEVVEQIGELRGGLVAECVWHDEV